MINKQNIIDVFVDKNNKIIPSRTTISYLHNHGYDELLTYYEDSNSVLETIYRIIHDLDIRPVCKVCGKPVKFSNIGFSNYCCPKCRNTSQAVIEKNKKSVSIALKNAYSLKGDEIKEKRSKALKEKYGEYVTSPFGLKSIQDKVKNTIQEKYGVDNVFKLARFRNTHEYWQNRSIEI